MIEIKLNSFSKRIFTGKASANETCQRILTNRSKTLKNRVNLNIPVNIVVFFDGIR